jgi:hypothetical protein
MKTRETEGRTSDSVPITTVRIDHPIRTGFKLGLGFAVILPVVVFIVGVVIGALFLIITGGP